jgi:hypothetical protein
MERFVGCPLEVIVAAIYMIFERLSVLSYTSNRYYMRIPHFTIYVFGS